MLKNYSKEKAMKNLKNALFHYVDTIICILSLFFILIYFRPKTLRDIASVV